MMELQTMVSRRLQKWDLKQEKGNKSNLKGIKYENWASIFFRCRRYEKEKARARALGSVVPIEKEEKIKRESGMEGVNGVSVANGNWRIGL